MTILILFFGVFFVSSVWAQECIKPTVLITTDDTLNDIDKDLYTEEFVNANNPVTSYECNPITNDIEFDIKVGDGKITIKKGLNFDKFDDYLDETSQTYTGQVKCTAICQNTASTSLYITITVKDTNQNDPEWNDPNPVLTLPMPLPKNLDVLLAGNLALKTTDKDFGNTEVTYELSSEAKTLFTPISTKNGKDYNLALKTTNKLNLLEDLSFTITATDNGDPTRSTEATFTLKINEDDSIPDKPNFEKSSYSYNFENGAIQPQDWDGKIVIETDQTNVEVSVDPTGAIDCIKNSDAKYTLECSYTGTDTLTKTTLYTVSAKTKDTATTTLIVFVASTGDGPQFVQSHYTANYNKDDNTLTLDNPIKTKETADSIVLVGDEYSGVLEFAKNKDEEWEITVKDSSKLTKNPTLIDFAAKSGDLQGPTSTLVINVPEKTLSITNSFYEGSYSLTDKLKIENPKLEGDDLDNVECSMVEATLAEYIKASYDKDAKECTIELVKDFSDEILAKAEVVFTLKASLTTDVTISDTCTIVVSLPQQSSDLPKFGKPYYVGNYENKDPLDTITIGESITITSSGDPTVTATWDISEKIDDYLNVNYDKDKKEVTVTVTKNFPDTVKASQDIIVTIEAKIDESNKGEGILVINLPSSDTTNAPKFDKPYYVGNYENKDPLDTITIAETITITSSGDPTVSLAWDISEKIEDYINVNYDKDKKEVTVTVTKNFPDTVKAMQDVIVTIEAKIDSNKGEGILVINLPSSDTTNAPKFDKPYYVGNYENKDPLDTITIADTITITSSGDPTVSLAWDISEKITDYLNVNYDKDKKEVTVTVTKNFPDTVKATQDIIVTIEAKIDESNKGEGILVINLPSSDTTNAPKFDKPYYVGNYENKDPLDTITIAETITITSSGDPTVSLAWDISEKITDYLNVNYDKDKKEVTVTVTKNFPDTVKATQDVIVTIEAKIDESNKGEGILVINLPSSDTTNAPKFEKPYYVGNYENKDPLDTITIAETITITSSGDPTVTLAWDISEKITDYLNVNYDKDKKEVIVTVTKNFPDTVKASQDIIITIEAKLDDNIGKGILIINLPVSAGSGPKFENPTYVGSYEASTKTLIIDDLKVQSDNLDKLTFSVNYDNIPQDSYLDLSIDSKTGIVKLATTSKELPTEEEHIIATISATDENNLIASTTVLIFVHKDNPTDPPEFLSSHYEATYDQNSKTVTLAQKIVFRNAQPDSILLSDEDAKYFSIEKDAKDEWKVNVNSDEPITDEMLHKDNVIVQMTAQGGTDVQSRATLIVLLPGLSAQYNQRSYSAVYTSDDDFSVDSKITIDNYLSTVKPKLVSPDYETYFTISHDGNVVTLTKNGDLSDDIKKKSFISLTIELDDSDVTTDSAVVNVQLPGDGTNSDTPKFGETYYVAKYEIKDPLDTITVDKSIIITSSGAPTVTLAWDISEKITDYLNVNYDKDKKEVTVTVIKNFPDTVKASQDVIVTIEAKIDESNKGEGILVINLPSSDTTNAPKFDKPYYVGNYENKDPLDTIIIAETITITSSGDPTVSLAWDISEKIDDYLNVNYDKDKKEVTVTVTKNFPDTVKATQDVIVTIEAKIDESNKGEGILVINLPSSDTTNAPKFDKPYYVGNYENKDPLDTIIIAETITITSSGDPTVSLAWDISEKIDDYLNVNYDKDKKEVTVTVTKNFPDTVKASQDIIVTIEAKLDDNIGKGILIINLPVSASSGPKFENPTYVGSYDAPTKTLTIDDLKVQSDNLDKLTFSVNYDKIPQDSYLDVSIDTETGIVKLTTTSKELPTEEDYIVATILATDEDNLIGSTTVLIFVLKDNPTDPPEFLSSHYEATYDQNSKTVTLAQKIAFKNAQPDKILLSDEDAKYFTVEKVEEEWKININSPITDEMLHKDNVIVQMTAQGGTDVQSRATLIVLLPGLSAQYNQRSYSAVYTSDDDFSVDSKITIDNYLSTVQPKLVSSDYQSFFAISSNGNEVTLAKTGRLTDEIKLKSFITLTIALQEGDETTDTSVVNIKLPGGGGGSDDDDDKDELEKKNKTIKGYIAAVSVLSVLLAAVIGGFAALYLLKFRRSKNYNTMEEEYPVRIGLPETKTAEKYDTPIGSVSQRRATGFVFNPPPPEEDEEDEEKTVKFNENVEQIKIEKSQDGSDYEEEEKPEKTETKEEDKEVKTNDDDLL